MDRRSLALSATLLLLVAVLIVPQGRTYAQSPLEPGEAFVTNFSGTSDEDGRAVIDREGTVGRIVDLRSLDAVPAGTHWLNEPQRSAVTAGQVGQVFGVTLDDADPPNIYLTATSAFGLHRNADNTDWMAGMWGPEGGPGTVWKLDAANGYQPEVLARIKLDGRANTGAGLGNIAFDRWNRQFYVSDLETGTIHRLRASDGEDLGRYDHGTDGRPAFLDVTTREFRSLPPVAFDPASSARLADCPSGDFARSPSCWNLADFRRRVWGVGVRRLPATEEVRLYYALWSSQGFGNEDYAAAGDDQRNAVWSVRIEDDGSFDTGSARREFFLPDFFREPEAIARAGRSHPVSDIAFPAVGDQDVMLLAERGGLRNRGLGTANAFAHPHEARVLRYELLPQGFWRGAGRYDVGYYDRSEAGPPYIRGGTSGGVSFAPGYDDAQKADLNLLDGFVWATGDGLCSPRGPCLDPDADELTETSDVNGLQGREARPYEAFEPITAFKPYPAPGPMTPTTGPESSFMVDLDDAPGEPDKKTGATEIGDVAVYQPVPAGAVPGQEQEEEDVAEDVPDEGVPGADEDVPPGLPLDPGYDPAPLPPDGWPVPPEPEIETDLAIEKTGPAQCQEGVNCTYTVKITNLGAVPYIGPLAVNDTMPVDASLASTSPGWHCDVTGQVVSCVTLEHANLGVGVSASLTLTVLLPADVAEDTVENCAAIDWFEMGTDDGPGDGNDYVCIDTPVTDGFDLGLEKTGPLQCVENGACRFDVTVTNYGPGEFEGVLAVRDTLPADATLLDNSFPGGCVQAAGVLSCVSVELTIPSGGSESMSVTVKLQDGIAGGTAENCAAIDWAAMGADDGAPDAHVDQDCHTVDILDAAGFFDLSVAKKGPIHCDEGGNCKYTITVTNHGPGDYMGEIAIRDTPPAGSARVGQSGNWSCIVVPPGAPIDCHILGGPHLLHPGDTESLTLTIQWPAPAPPEPVTNCAELPWGGIWGMPADDNPGPGLPGPGLEFGSDKSCTVTFVGEGFDIEIGKTGPAECYEGGICEYVVSLTNRGPKLFVGALYFIDTLPAGAVLEEMSGAWRCEPGAAGTVSCADAWLWGFPAAETKNVTLKVRLPDPVAGETVTNCAEIDWNGGPIFGLGVLFTSDEDAGTDGPVCVETPVLAADLAPFGGTVCALGETCSLDVLIENRGGRLFKGRAGLKGQLDPAASITSIEALDPGVACEVTGNGTYECNADALTLKPRDAVTVNLAIDIPADYPHKRIVHRKEMVWPDAEVKDAKPGNDRHTSTITIAQPEEPEQPPQPEPKPEPEEEPEVEEPEAEVPLPACVGGSIVRGDCVCPKGTERTKTGTNAYACKKLPPPITCKGGTVRDRQCICPKGTTRKKTGTYAYTCVKLPPPITCKGGTVRDRQCVCPKGTERKKKGTYSYTCEKLPPPITCKGGTVRDRQCICPKGTERKKTGKDAYTCVKLPPPITCKGGTVRDRQCVCPKGTTRKQTGKNTYACEKLPPPLICLGGSVRDRQCICPKGTKRKQANAFTYTCEKLPPKITCRGGKVSKGQCICPKGTNRKQTGKNAYTCVKPPPPITCKGGTVRDRQCICPKGTTRKQTGKNAYACEKLPPPITCAGGTVRNGQCICPKGTTRKLRGEYAYACVKLPPPITCRGGRVYQGQCVCPGGTKRKQVGKNAYVCETQQPQQSGPSMQITPEIKIDPKVLKRLQGPQ